MTASHPRIDGSWEPNQQTFAQAFPDFETLKVTVGFTAPEPSKCDTWEYRLQDKVPRSERKCDCGKGSFDIGSTIRSLPEKRQVLTCGRLGCSYRMSVEVEATYKNKGPK